MSVENAKAFIEKLNSDETFRNRIAEAGDDQARLHMAREAGYEFTAAEFNNTVAKMTGAADELADEELELVSGGISLNFEEIKFKGLRRLVGDEIGA